MNVTILGAAGKTGTELVNQALKAGYNVTAFVRDPSAYTRSAPGLAVVSGDARDSADLAKAFAGQDAILNTLGSMKAGDQLMTRSADALVSAAIETGVDRVISMSSYLVAPGYQPNFMGKVIGAMIKGVIADKTAGDQRIANSTLNWTIVYATALDKADAGKAVRVIGSGESASMSNGIARADVAQFMIAQLTATTYDRAKVLITTK